MKIPIKFFLDNPKTLNPIGLDFRLEEFFLKAQGRKSQWPMETENMDFALFIYFYFVRSLLTM